MSPRVLREVDKNSLNRAMGSMGKSSRYLGVTLFKPTGKWRAQVRYVLYLDPPSSFSTPRRTQVNC